jgi:hypothetical protein
MASKKNPSTARKYSTTLVEPSHEELKFPDWGASFDREHLYGLDYSSENAMRRFLECLEEIPLTIRAAAFHDAWITDDAPGRYLNELLCLDLRRIIGCRRSTQSHDTNRVETTKAFRGVGNLMFPRGMSWTTDQDIATFFAFDYCRIRHPRPAVLAANIPEHYIMFRTAERNESEIVIWPEFVRILDWQILSKSRRGVTGLDE